MRILALDVGKRRIGIAVSDELEITAQPHSTIERSKDAPERISSIAKELNVGRVLVGLPLHLAGTEGAQAHDVRAFASKLDPLIAPIPLEFCDERLTTIEARQRLAARTKNWIKDKGRIDAAAAAVILEDYLKTR
jgi:putative Holliday junction resolvase